MNGEILKVVEQQSKIISIQNGIIDELFLLLLQHISVEETMSLPIVPKIRTVAEQVSKAE